MNEKILRSVLKLSLASALLIVTLIIAHLILADTAEANSVQLQQGWQLSSDGTATWFSNGEDNISGQGFLAIRYMVKLTATTTNAVPIFYEDFVRCSGGSNISTSNFTVNDLLGINVYDDGGIGDGDCTDTGLYWLVVMEPTGLDPVTATTSVKWIYQLYYDENTGLVNAAQQTEGCILGYTCPFPYSTSTVSELTLECDPNDSFFSRSICALGVFLFVPSPAIVQSLNNELTTLKTKQPFSAFEEFKTGWDNANQNPTTTPTFLVFNLYGQEIEIISTSTINNIAGNSMSNIRGLIAIAIYVLLGWFLYRRVLNAFS